MQGKHAEAAEAPAAGVRHVRATPGGVVARHHIPRACFGADTACVLWRERWPRRHGACRWLQAEGPNTHLPPTTSQPQISDLRPPPRSQTSNVASKTKSVGNRCSKASAERPAGNCPMQPTHYPYTDSDRPLLGPSMDPRHAHTSSRTRTRISSSEQRVRCPATPLLPTPTPPHPQTR
jgi:hypothetical protein